MFENYNEMLGFNNSVKVTEILFSCDKIMHRKYLLLLFFKDKHKRSVKFLETELRLYSRMDLEFPKKVGLRKFYASYLNQLVIMIDGYSKNKKPFIRLDYENLQAYHLKEIEKFAKRFAKKGIGIRYQIFCLNKTETNFSNNFYQPKKEKDNDIS